MKYRSVLERDREAGLSLIDIDGRRLAVWEDGVEEPLLVTENVEAAVATFHREQLDRRRWDVGPMPVKKLPERGHHHWR